MVKQKEKMNIARVNKISEFKGQVVQLNGWVYNSRRSGKIGFLMLRDGFGVWCVVLAGKGEASCFILKFHA